METLLDDGDEDIDRHGDPDLRLHRILGSAVEILDTQMLLDPFEKQFHLPARLVERADGGGREREVVGEEHQCLAGIGILEADASRMFGIVLAAGGAGEYHGLIADSIFMVRTVLNSLVALCNHSGLNCLDEQRGNQTWQPFTYATSLTNFTSASI